jgi:hypothetical protein
MGQKIKHREQWVDPLDLPAIREAEKPPDLPAPPVDVAALPPKEALDPDVPLEQLFFERPEVRRYITKTGQVRSGLSPSEKETSEAILKRYGGQA